MSPAFHNDHVHNGDAQVANDNVATQISHSDGIPVEAPLDKQTLASKAFANGISDVKILPREFYEPFFSESSRRRKPNPIRGLFPLELRPGMLSLLAGKPNPSMFPITSMNISVRSPSDPAKEEKIELPETLLAEGLQYGATAGHPQLLNWLAGLQEYSHKRKVGEGWRVSMGAGSQDLIYKFVHSIVNKGDIVLIESPVYSGIINCVEEVEAEVVAVDTDAHGIKSSELRQILEHWPAGKPMPKFLYTVPFGCNPTGMTATDDRRREVLELARKYNFLVLEDDPYYYIYYGKAPRPSSYFELELEQPEVGRVVRLDSFSKIISAGIRIGFASGPAPILDVIDIHTSNSNLQVSTLTQAITLSLLQSWGYDNFKLHTEQVADFYRQKRDVFERAMKHHLTGLVEWETPEAGMFFWFKLVLNDPSKPGEREECSETVIRTKALEKGVLALPGTSFLPNGGKTAYVRASFSLIENENVDEALRRLKDTLLEARSS
ncbi:PLP-dependent transferase [Schizopora paradoxa]|uniref:PLP-dependent transferase n=1 Tax=Schizopora paradoxa TaxID=27342 RepID=A0A0H2R828_9AGAM|nr:PLP-dependent transferase [Schizopora paradoxa]